jgi:hypothetical protein
MKTFIFMAIFFSGSSIFSMNSTENKRALVELADIDSLEQELINLDACLDMLSQEGKLGDIHSQKAYEAFVAIANRDFPVISKRSMTKLAYYSLAHREPNSHEFVVDSCKVDLWNKYRRNAKAKGTNG